MITDEGRNELRRRAEHRESILVKARIDDTRPASRIVDIRKELSA